MGITANSNHRVVYPHCNFSLLLFDFGACVCMLFCVFFSWLWGFPLCRKSLWSWLEGGLVMLRLSMHRLIKQRKSWIGGEYGLTLWLLLVSLSFIRKFSYFQPCSWLYWYILLFLASIGHLKCLVSSQDFVDWILIVFLQSKVWDWWYVPGSMELG